MTKMYDFEGRFSQDYFKWCAKHPETANDEEKLERAFPLLYERWYSSPKSWLSGKTPVEYFREIDNAGLYISMLIDYVKDDVPLPDILVDCITDKKDESARIFTSIINANSATDIEPAMLRRIQAYAVDFMSEMGCMTDPDRAIELLCRTQEDDLLSDTLYDALLDSTPSPALYEKLLAAARATQGEPRRIFADLLCGYPANDDTYKIVMDDFLSSDEHMPFYASCLGRLGDQRAVEALRGALDEPFLSYAGYLTVKEALEELTGEPEEHERVFEGDPYYELMKKETNDQ